MQGHFRILVVCTRPSRSKRTSSYSLVSVWSSGSSRSSQSFPKISRRLGRLRRLLISIWSSRSLQILKTRGRQPCSWVRQQTFWHDIQTFWHDIQTFDTMFGHQEMIFSHAYDTKVFIILLERNVKMKNGVYFIVIALLVAESFKSLSCSKELSKWWRMAFILLW